MYFVVTIPTIDKNTIHVGFSNLCSKNVIFESQEIYSLMDEMSDYFKDTSKHFECYLCDQLSAIA